MADRAPQRIQTESLQDDDSNKENTNEDFEPVKKKSKVDLISKGDEAEHKLEERLCGILCCAVCLDLPRICYQVRKKTNKQTKKPPPSTSFLS